MIRYISVGEDLHSEELGEYHSYGICAVDDNNEEMAFISDVATDEKTVTHIAKLCTDGQLDPQQLKDVVLNFLE